MINADETREEKIRRAVSAWERVTDERIRCYLKDYHNINRGSVLLNISPLSQDRGLKCFFVDGDVAAAKRNFFVASKLAMASQIADNSSLNVFATNAPFLYGLLSDSPEIYGWLAHAELMEEAYVKGPQFVFHQYQLVLRHDDDALCQTIATVAKKGGGRNRYLAQAGHDFFSLLLKQDKEGLQVLIENQVKMKSEHELEGKFLARIAVIHAKLCWYRGIEVQIQNPLVPMPLMPIKPLDAYDVEYEFLRPGWTPPPPPGMFSKVKRLFS